METELLQAAGLLSGSLPICVLTGAGISTESGIPDYRGPERRGRPATPIQYKEFVSSEEARRRYWARSAIGWLPVNTALPNLGHQAVTALESQRLLSGIITQNVDGLHQRSGSKNVVELHGTLDRVICLTCAHAESRASLQERIHVLNPGFDTAGGEIAPDGDVHLPQATVESFVVPACLRCGGPLKPDVVFFGDSVPKERVLRAFEMLSRAGSLLVIGSSLTVYSGYRFVDRAVREQKPVIVLNDGPTRADEVVSGKVEGRLGALLPRLVEILRNSTSISKP